MKTNANIHHKTQETHDGLRRGFGHSEATTKPITNTHLTDRAMVGSKPVQRLCSLVRVGKPQRMDGWCNGYQSCWLFPCPLSIVSSALPFSTVPSRGRNLGHDHVSSFLILFLIICFANANKLMSIPEEL